MRKAILVVAVLTFAVPALAGTVTMSVDDVGQGWAAIRYSADTDVSAFGLKVTADSGAVITDIKDYNVGESKSGNLGYGIFPGTIDINATTGAVDSNGTPIAPNDAPGAAATGLGTDTIILEMGALYEDGNKPGLSGTLILVQVDKDCNVCVEGESVRGKVVLTDANEAILVPAKACSAVQFDCLQVGEVIGGVLITQAMYDQWVTNGKPDCWCYDCHWRADTDGDCDVDTADIVALLDGWNGYQNPCGDTDNDGDVDTADIVAGLDGWDTQKGCNDPCHPDKPCTPLP